ncbi:hypothetical protein GGR54DRAFT_584008 [Hypoxylon sp. NC1633]|nr:hypothetical protein GGR54DRAFT_584008 [Hypoxylon sp. NC1633]
MPKLEEGSPSAIATIAHVNSSGSTAPSYVSTFPSLQQASMAESLEALDQYKTIGIAVLDEILMKLNQAPGSLDVAAHAKAIRDLKERAHNPKTILGVVGSTGHGKSSLINALLDEERLVPTNCVRACTAVVTEISWNKSDDPEQRYMAEIDFISEEDWRRELEILFQDLAVSAAEPSASFANGDSDIDVAWAKVKAVYPALTRDQLSQTNAATLMSDATVQRYLGSPQTVTGPEASSFHKNVQVYIDSLRKEWAAENVKDEKQSIELWPLVKVVRIYTKADVLSTGAVIVDLPGVEDSNAARAAIAENYMAKCSGIWVVAGITRAINDRVAQKLLGQSFKLQINCDGNYSGLTFVCSKTDDINVNESAEFLGLEEQLNAFRRTEADLGNWEERSKQQLRNDEHRSKCLSDYRAELDTRLRQWEKLETRQRKGNVVTASQISSKKRKSSARVTRAGKRLKTGSSSGADDEALPYVSAAEFWDSLNDDIPGIPAAGPLSEDQIRSAINYLREKRDIAGHEMDRLDDVIDDGTDTHQKLKDEFEKEQANLLSSCIRKRNEYTRDVMRKDFAQGLRELDQETSQCDDPDGFDPEVDIHDYNGIARSLEVFCVSSKAYQGLCGRLGRGLVQGFANQEDTGIPQLIAHAKKLTEAGRSSNNKSFMNGLLQVFNSLYMWCSAQYTGGAFSEEDKKAKMNFVNGALNDLDKDLQRLLDILVQKSKAIAVEQLSHRLEVAVVKAINEAPTIADRWPRRHPGGEGLAFNSYMAACRRDGVYSGKVGQRNFNAELVHPIKVCIVKKWAKAFRTKIPRALDEFACGSERLLGHYHSTIKGRIQETTSSETTNTLQSQLKTRVLGIRHMVTSFNDKEITPLQRKASRKLSPEVRKQLENVYSICAQETGKGMFARAQKYMLEHIMRSGRYMFGSATDAVKQDLVDLCEVLQATTKAKIAEMLGGMHHDYTNIIMGQPLSESSKKARDELLEFLKKVDERFGVPMVLQ